MSKGKAKTRTILNDVMNSDLLGIETRVRGEVMRSATRSHPTRTKRDAKERRGSLGASHRIECEAILLACWIMARLMCDVNMAEELELQKKNRLIVGEGLEVRKRRKT